MKPQLRVAFAYFWPGFTADHFRAFFPFVYDKYDLVPSQNPEIVFYSVFAPQFRPYADPRHHAPVARIRLGTICGSSSPARISSPIWTAASSP